MNPPPTLTRRDFARQIAAGVGGAVIGTGITNSTCAATERAASVMPTQPNIVFILSDQHAYKYCGFMGHPVVRTPNLDRIAAQGVVFRNAYCGSPVCCPSRSGMISGAYGSDVNSFCNATAWDGSIPAWPALLRDAGYRTFGVGKLDANAEYDLGFTHGDRLANQHAISPDVTAFFRRPVCSRIDERLQVDGRARQERFKDARTTSACIDFIRKQSTGGKPWAAYCGTTLPHPPFVGLNHYYERYLRQVELPNIPLGHLEELPFLYQQLRHFKNIATPIPEERQRRARAGYYAMISELDEYVGQVWSALEETGQLERTIFVYTSDHGESLGEHGLWFKNNLYDVSVRVPLIVAGAGIPAGGMIDTAVAHVDVVRTFLELGGAKLHSRLRGHSLLPLMRAQPGDHPGFAYSESHSEGNCTGSFMIRKGDWKYVHIAWHDGLLFNLAEDPGEFCNRFNDPAARGVLEDLQATLDSQVDWRAVTERAFAVQRRRMDRLADGISPDAMLGHLRRRLGEGQAVELLNEYYGRPFAYTRETAPAATD